MNFCDQHHRLYGHGGDDEKGLGVRGGEGPMVYDKWWVRNPPLMMLYERSQYQKVEPSPNPGPLLSCVSLPYRFYLHPNGSFAQFFCGTSFTMIDVFIW